MPGYGRSKKIKHITRIFIYMSASLDRSREGSLALPGKLEAPKPIEITDPVFALHCGGKIGVQCKVPVDSRETLSLAYTPGVGRVSSAIAEDHSRVWSFTAKSNSVAIVTDGTAVLGLG